MGVITRIKANLSSTELGLTSKLELSLATGKSWIITIITFNWNNFLYCQAQFKLASSVPVQLGTEEEDSIPKKRQKKISLAALTPEGEIQKT